METIIIEGYKGVMPLDLTDVDPKYHKIMIAQHEEDIKEYNRYQQSLPSRLQYENTTEKAKNLLQSDQEWTKRIADKKRLEETKNDYKITTKELHLSLNSFTRNGYRTCEECENKQLTIILLYY